MTTEVLNIKVTTKDFLEALSVGSQFAGKNKALSALDNVKVQVSGLKLIVTSTNIENTILKKMNAIEVDGGEQKATFLVEPNGIISLLRTIKDEFITLKLKDNSISIKHASGSAKFPILSADDFPLYQKEEQKIVNVSSTLLRQWIGAAKDFVSNDTLRPIMSGIYLELNDNILSIASTDAIRLFTDHIDFTSPFNEKLYSVIPPLSIRPILDVIEDCDNEVQVGFTDSNVTFRSETCMVVAKKIEGNYPNFRAVIPNDKKLTVNVKPQLLIDSLKRVVSTSNKNSSLVKLNIKENGIELTSEDLDLSVSSNDFCEAQANGEITIGVKCSLFLSILSLFSSFDELEMDFIDPLRPIIVRDKNSDTMRILIMPMMLN